MEARVLKKYWKIIVMSMVILLGISVHYMQMAKAINKGTVDFSIDTVTGDETLFDERIVQISYYDRYINNWAYVSKDGVKDVVDHQMSSSFYRAYEPFEMKHHLTEYRSFMRGKDLVRSSFYEDDTQLVYVKVPNNSKSILKGEPLPLTIERLMKDTNERVKFEAKALAKSGYSWLNVEDVRLADGIISVLVMGSSPNGETDLQLYTIDEATKQVTNTETLHETNREGDMSSTIYYYGEASLTGNTDYYVYQQSSWTYNEKTGHEEQLKSDYYMYDYATKQVETIEDAELFHTAFQHEDVFYGAMLEQNAVVLHAYHLAEKKWGEPLRMPLQVNGAEEDAKFVINFERTPHVQVIGEHVYAANPNGNTMELFVYALTGELLYSGLITAEGATDLAEMYVERIY